MQVCKQMGHLLENKVKEMLGILRHGFGNEVLVWHLNLTLTLLRIVFDKIFVIFTPLIRINQISDSYSIQNL